jgi:cytochrome c-type biogenesis protein CcmH/NrfG
MDKIAALSEILELDPTNAFARYGLAMEYIAQGRHEAGLTEFTTLISHNPDYVPAFQMSAQTLLQLGRAAEAHQRLQAGIAAAQRTGNQHAITELTGLLEGLDAPGLAN